MGAVADINSKVADAIAAHEAGDVATALLKLRSAKMLLSAIPDSRHPDSELRWDRSAIDSMITSLSAIQAASAAKDSGGIRRTKIEYVRPGCDDDNN